MVYIILGLSATFVILGQTFFLYLALKSVTKVEEEKVKVDRQRLIFEREKRREDLKREKMWIDSLSKAPPEEEGISIESSSEMGQYLDEREK